MPLLPVLLLLLLVLLLPSATPLQPSLHPSHIFPPPLSFTAEHEILHARVVFDRPVRLTSSTQLAVNVSAVSRATGVVRLLDVASVSTRTLYLDDDGDALQRRVLVIRLFSSSNRPVSIVDVLLQVDVPAAVVRCASSGRPSAALSWRFGTKSFEDSPVAYSGAIPMSPSHSTGTMLVPGDINSDGLIDFVTFHDDEPFIMYNDAPLPSFTPASLCSEIIKCVSPPQMSIATYSGEPMLFYSSASTAGVYQRDLSDHSAVTFRPFAFAFPPRVDELYDELHTLTKVSPDDAGSLFKPHLVDNSVVVTLKYDVLLCPMQLATSHSDSALHACTPMLSFLPHHRSAGHIEYDADPDLTQVTNRFASTLVADYTADGCADLCVMWQSPSGAFVDCYPGNCSQTDQPRRFDVHLAPQRFSAPAGSTELRFVPFQGTPSFVFNANADDVIYAYRVPWDKNVTSPTTTAYTPLATKIPAGSPVRFGDVDGDGDLDALVTEELRLGVGGTRFSLMLNQDGGASFTRPSLVHISAATVVHDMGVVDIDGDGVMDLYAATSNGAGLFWLRPLRVQNEVRVLETREIVPPVGDIQDRPLSHAALRLMDVDQDGDLDIVAYIAHRGLINLYRNTDGMGTMSLEPELIFAFPGAPDNVTYATTGLSWMIPIHDVDGDGLLDLIIGSSALNKLYFLSNAFAAGGRPQRVVELQDTGAETCLFVDITGDGHLDAVCWGTDMAAPGTANQHLFYLANSGLHDQPFQSAQVPLLVRASHIAAVVGIDADFDERPDLALAYSDADGVPHVSILNAATQFRVLHSVFSVKHAVHAMIAADVQGDGVLDLIVASQTDVADVAPLSWVDGLSLMPDVDAVVTKISEVQFPTVIRAADMNHDGAVDLITGGPQAEASVLLNHVEDIHFDAPVPVFAPESPLQAGSLAIDVGDVDGDGDLDVVTLADGALSITRLYTGRGVFPGRYISNRIAPGVNLDVVAQGISPLHCPPGGAIVVQMEPGVYKPEDAVLLSGHLSRLLVIQLPPDGITIDCSSDGVRRSRSPCLTIVGGGAGSGVRIVGGTLNVVGGDNVTVPVDQVVVDDETLKPSRFASLVLVQHVYDNMVQSRVLGLSCDQATLGFCSLDSGVVDSTNTDRFGAAKSHDGVALRISDARFSSIVSDTATRDTLHQAACLSIRSSSKVDINHMLVTRCFVVSAAGSGCILAVDVDVLELTNNDISQCLGPNSGAFYSTSLNTLRILDSQFSHLQSQSTGGIYVANLELVHLDRVEISNSASTGNCGGIRLDAVRNFQFANLRMHDNTASVGGALCAEQSPGRIASSLFSQNTATLSGGAIYMVGSAINMVGGTVAFEDNLAVTGGAVFCQTGSLLAYASRFSRNKAVRADANAGLFGSGGAITLSSCSLRVFLGTRFVQNSAIENGGAIYCERFSFTSEASVVITGSSFFYNSVIGRGGALHSEECAVRVAQVQFVSNSAGRGGAISVAWAIQSSMLAIGSSTFTSNSAIVHGGAVYADAYPLVAKSSKISLVSFTGDITARNNRASNGGGGFFYWTPFDTEFSDLPMPRLSFKYPSTKVNRNTALYGNTVATRAVRIVVDTDTISTTQQESRMPLKGMLRFRLEDAYDTPANDPSANVALRISATARDATLIGADVDLKTDDAYFTLYNTGLALEAPPGSTQQLSFTPVFLQRQFYLASPPTITVRVRRCTPGEFVESLRCEQCPLGRFSSSFNAPRCLDCPVGRFGDRPALSQCAPCPPGQVAVTRGLLRCTACGLGRYVPTVDGAAMPTSQCLGCPIHTAGPKEGLSECEPCKLPFAFANGTANVRCFECGSTEYPVCLTQDGRKCDLQGRDGLLHSGRGYLKCWPCPDNTRCEGIVQDKAPRSTVTAEAGYWVSLDESGEAHVFPCSRDMCVGGDRCADGRAQPPDDNPLCGRCEDGLYEWGDECVSCDGDRTRWDILALLWLGSFVFVWGYHFIVQRSSAELGILIYFFQMALLFSDAELDAFVLHFVEGNVLLASGATCLAPVTPRQHLLLTFVGPAAFYLNWALLLCCAVVARKIRHSHRRSRMEDAQLQHLDEYDSPDDDHDDGDDRLLDDGDRLLDDGDSDSLSFDTSPSIPSRSWWNWSAPYWRSLCGIFILTFNIIVETALAYLNCVTIRVDGEEQHVVQSVPAVSCDTTGYRTGKAFMILVLVIELAVIPGALVYRLWRGTSGTITRDFRRIMGVLFEVFRPHHFFWTFWALLRRTALVGVSVYFANNRTNRFAVLSMLNVAILLIHVLARPYRSDAVNVAEGVSHTMLTVLTLVLPMTSDPATSTELVVISLIMGVPALGLFVWIARRFAVRLARRRRLRQIDKVESQAQMSYYLMPDSDL